VHRVAGGMVAWGSGMVAWSSGMVAWWLVAWVGGMMAYYSGSCIFVLRNAYPPFSISSQRPISSSIRC
jgi:hypothetical protein